MIITYVIHCEREPDAPLHYIGSARADQFHRRMGDHLANNGCPSTRELWENTDRWVLVATYRSEDRAVETALLKTIDRSILCPICTPTGAAALTTEVRVMREEKPQWKTFPSLTWSSGCGPMPK